MVGNSMRFSFSDESYTENVYSASGEKLRMTHATSLNGTVTGKTTTEYRGNNWDVINGSTGAVFRMAFGKHCKARIKKEPNLTIGLLFEYGL